MNDVKVEQVDRDAAADWFGQSSASKIRSGERDNPLVAAFARHRQAAEKATRESIAQMIDDWDTYPPNPSDAAVMCVLAVDLATAIRSQNDG